MEEVVFALEQPQALLIIAPTAMLAPKESKRRLQCSRA